MLDRRPRTRDGLQIVAPGVAVVTLADLTLDVVKAGVAKAGVVKAGAGAAKAVAIVPSAVARVYRVVAASQDAAGATPRLRNPPRMSIPSERIPMRRPSRVTPRSKI